MNAPTRSIACARIALVAGLLAMSPVPSAAQAVVNPTTALFNSSPDHNATNADGTPVVQSYSLEFYLVGAQAPFVTNALGKPAPDGANTITVNLASILVGWPLPGTNYVADVAAIGSGGTAKSAQSNTFSFTGACSPGLSSTSQSMAAAGGTGSTNVTAGTGCTWTGVSNAGWISVTAGSSGSGNGTVAFGVAANTSTTARAGTLTIAGQTFTVSQAGACSYSVSPISQSVVAAGGTGTTTVTTTGGCTWTATSNAAWITVTAGGSGTASGPVNFTVAANTATTPRTGTLTIAGKTFTVSQAGACSYSVSPTSQSVVSAGGTGTTTVTTTSGCTWTATSNVAWIVVTAGGNGTASGPVNFTVAANSATTSRVGTLTIAGQIYTVTEAASLAAPTNLRITGA